ncbi:MAG: hypothetical protein KA149_03275 [Chitinophagales bacterium]|nr:hypothetical protein [Chitinophagales bacterium]
MQKMFKPLTALTLVLLSVTAVVAAITTLDIETFESDFIKTLKEKFKNFYAQTAQDRVYVQTDKTFYQPGETIWFTAYVRDEKTLKPSNNSDIIHVEFITPKGTTEKHFKIVAKNGAAQGDFNLSGHPGGLYKIKAYTEWQKNEENGYRFEKEITVQNVVMPRLKMKLDFEKKAYGKGDEVVATLELNTNVNKALANTKVKFKAQLEGKELKESTATTDADGKVNLKFTLPKDLNSIDGTVNALIEFEGTTESISRSVPIVLNKITMEFYPEGGDMVANVNSRVAFRAQNEFGKAADIEGIIVDSKGAFVTKFSSYHFGMGAVEFLPKTGETYMARITKPEGMLNEFILPEALKAGYVLQANQSATNLQLGINSWQSEQLSVVAQTRGKIYYAKAFNAVKGANQLYINTAHFPIGVSQITLFDSKGIARAERLVFANKNQQLNIAITTGKQQYQPREKVNMNIRVTDENGLPVQGNFSLSVVDDNLLSFADDKQGTILSKILLEPDLKEKVEEPDFYFNKKEAKADKALDLLMLTSGWRKYAWKQINDEDLPEVKFASEKAVFSGIVYDGYNGKPLPGTELKLTASGKTAITDKEGKFSFSKFDIAASNQITISAVGHQTQTQNIYNYGTNNAYYLYDVHTRRYMEQQIPMAAAGRAEMAEERMALDVVVVAGNKYEKKLAHAPAPLRALKDAEKKPKDVADDIAPVNEEIAVDEQNIAKAKVGDFRFAQLQDFDKNVENQNAVTFYRAKEFAKKNYSAADTTRNDLATTVYWNGNVATDQSGRTKVEFVTNDLISSFKTTVEGFGEDGSIGHAEANFATGMPFSIDAKIPTEMVSGDKMMLPVFLKNNSAEELRGKMMVMAPKQLNITHSQTEVTLPPYQTKVVYIEATAANQIGAGQLEIKFTSDKQNDALTRAVNVVAKGFPASISLCGQDMQKEFAINPVNVVPGSMKVDFSAYPNVMTELMSGVESILREPYGCFEQTSSSNYPNIMVLQYLKSMKIDDPKLEARATKLLDDGYKKLAAFETKENGYEWFGAAPAHEALTAYGLMEFMDMKGVYKGVDDKMIDRTVKLLLEKRDGNGGFKKNPRALDSFGGADEDITNAYIVYALSEAGYKDIAKELAAVEKEARKSNDPYLMALCANALFNAGEEERGEKMLAQLINGRNEAGFWTGKKHSITRSGGESLKTETTSLILLALLKAKSPDVASVTSAVKYLVGARSGYGGFGSTQATILALKALTKYAEFSKKTDEAGTIELLVNGTVVAQKDYAKGERNNVAITGLENFIKQGKQKIEVRFKGCKQALPYAMNVAYSTSLPESAKECVVSLETKLAARQVKVGETLRLSATLKNKTNTGQPMTMAIIGIPAGFSAQPWQLKEMQEKGVIDFYEVIGNNIACYYRSLAPGQQKQVNLDLKAEIPGEYDAPASSAYLYYTSEHKNWAATDRVFVNP